MCYECNTVGFVSLASVDVIERNAILDGILEDQDAAVWAAILRCKHMGGDERVLSYLRREGSATFAMWSDAELLSYLEVRDLTLDFTLARDRAVFSY